MDENILQEEFTEPAETELSAPDTVTAETVPSMDFTDTTAEVQDIAYSELARYGTSLSLKVCGMALIASLGIAVIIKLFKIQ